MRLLPAVSFLGTVSSAMSELENIARIMKRYAEWSNKSDEFLEACKRVDYEIANEILDSFVMDIARRKSVDDALIYFARKFGYFDEVCEKDGATAKVKAIYKHYDDIKRQLDDRKK